MKLVGSVGPAMAAGCVMALFASVAAAQTYTFTLLPSDVASSPLKALARGVSGDGNVIVGSSNTILSADEKPYVWRRVAGVWTRSELPTVGGTGRAAAASFDGSVIVGMTGRYVNTTVNAGTPAVWRDTASISPTLETPLISASPTGGPLRGIFNGVSASGTRAFGFARELDGNLTSSAAYVYNQGGSVTPVATFAQFTGAYPASSVMSADGTRATHYIQPDVVSGSDTAFVWDETGGSTNLPLVTSQGFYPRTTTISGDGRVVAGFLGNNVANANTSGFPIVWRDGVFRMLPRPNFASGNFIAGSDTTGRVLVGAAGSGLDLVNFTTNIGLVGNSFASIWIDDQAFSLATYLTSNGVNLGNVTPILASGVSADGRTVVGVATRPIGTTTQREYVSFIATIPTPGTLFGMSLCVVAAMRRRR
ncbi:MAG TPA: hypothetical protein VK157_13810 [Phycisphaerales bacterium]|nr:hypothetical protein [Phycisphaerales bacterium]